VCPQPCGASSRPWLGEGWSSRSSKLGQGVASDLLIVAAYVISGRLGLSLAVPPGYASAIFPPAGIAVAAMLMGGRATLRATFIGSLLLNIWIGHILSHRLDGIAIAAALIIATGSATQAGVGGWALRRAIGYPIPLDRGGDLLRFLLLSPICCLTSASLSLAGLWGVGAVNDADLLPSWFAWWAGDTLGVLTILPLALVAVGEPRALWRSRAVPVAVPMLLFFGLFVVIFIQVNRWERNQSLLEFRLVSQQLADKLRAGLQAQEVFLDELAASLAGHSVVTRADFRELVSNLLRRFATIQAVEWAPEIADAERTQFELAERRELPGFEIREKGPDEQTHPAEEHERYVPVTYIEPLRGNEEAIGLDLSADHVRSAAVAETMQTGSVAATAPVRLVQEPGEPTGNKQAGVLLLQAVFGGANGRGVVLSVLRMGSYMDALVGPLSQIVNVELVDLDQGVPLYQGPVSEQENAGYRQDFEFGGRHYSLRTAPTAVYLREHHGWQSWAVLAGGLLSTSLLGALLILGTGYTRRVERLVEDRTSDLAAANQRLRVEIEERQQAEFALRQAQRMEAIGQLTGGIAHDFNNLLAVIMANAEMAKRRMDYADPALLERILRAGERGASLTRQLLTFSRRQAVTPRPFDLAAEMPRIAEMLRASLRGDIEFTCHVPSDVWAVEVDPGEFEVALLNIAVNARDAMASGGRFEVEANNVMVRAGSINAAPSLQGEHVAVHLCDTGTGIAPEVMGRVFEPFFTTKDVGSGTGLGLSQVYGFAQQSGGHAVIESKLGVGTCVTLYLPRTRKPLGHPEERHQQSVASSIDMARVLLVEDNAEVAEATAGMLRAMSCEVEIVDRAGGALKRLEADSGSIDLMLSDIVMPAGMNGFELALQVRKQFPLLPILLMSGYNETAQVAEADRAEAAQFRLLRKPVAFAELETAVHEELGRPS
jgi:signal transduction histidine kinase/CheY-like chemotaxis protein